MRPIGLLLLQLTLVIAAARILGSLFRRFRQPAVVGEMVAGIALGPSLLGHLLPAQHRILFPEESRLALTVAAQSGVMLFMLAVGTRIEFDVFRRHSRAIALIAAAGVTVPFVLGGALGVLLYSRFADPLVSRLPFTLFIATAMSVTAFPVLARIVMERGLGSTVPGKTALVCAAINDAVAWVLVAIVVVLVAGNARPVPPVVHGVFVAFAAGVLSALAWPRLAARIQSIEAVVSRLLLPVFFVLTGLRTDLRLLGLRGTSWVWCVLIVVVATAGKLGGAALAARAAGMSRADSLTLGALMNTRGLMELVVLNIGYELGLLPPGVFAMMVVMALATTCAAGPLVDRWSREDASAARRPPSRRRTRTTDAPPSAGR